MIEIVDSHELFPAMELDVQLVKLPSGELVVRFTDCTGLSPIIYGWALKNAVKWLEGKI